MSCVVLPCVSLSLLWVCCVVVDLLLFGYFVCVFVDVLVGDGLTICGAGYDLLLFCLSRFRCFVNVLVRSLLLLLCFFVGGGGYFYLCVLCGLVCV